MPQHTVLMMPTLGWEGSNINRVVSTTTLFLIIEKFTEIIFIGFRVSISLQSPELSSYPDTRKIGPKPQTFDAKP